MARSGTLSLCTISPSVRSSLGRSGRTIRSLRRQSSSSTDSGTTDAPSLETELLKGTRKAATKKGYNL